MQLAMHLLLWQRPLGALGVRTARAGVVASRRPMCRDATRIMCSVASPETKQASPVPTLDERLVTEDPETVLGMLRKRRASEEQLSAVARIGQLTSKRAEFVEAGNAARAQRKTLSAQIGAMYKSGDEAGAAALKEQVAVCAEQSDAADAELEQLELERARHFEQLPNLLDARVPEGADENDNVEVSSWGCEGELPTGRVWHDEVASALGGLDLEAAAKLSGARFAVLRGSLARLERALANFFVDVHVDRHAPAAPLSA